MEQLWEDVPIYNLIDKTLDQMTEEELRSYVVNMRQLRTTPQTFKSKIELEAKPKKLSKTKINDDNLLSSLIS